MPKKGEHMTKEARDKLSASCMGRIPWNKGIPHKESTKQKMREKKIGIPLSEEHKKNLSISHKGQIPNITTESIEKNRLKHLGKNASEETRKKMSQSHIGREPSFKGKKHSEKTKEKMSISHKGKRKSPETRKRMSGENNNRWNGGITPLLKTIRELPEMSEWRNKVMTRDNYRDCFTGSKGSGNLEAHHIIPFSTILKKYKIESVSDALQCKELWDIHNGVTMFKESHSLHHKKYKNAVLPKEYYSKKENN